MVVQEVAYNDRSARAHTVLRIPLSMTNQKTGANQAARRRTIIESTDDFPDMPYGSM